MAAELLLVGVAKVALEQSVKFLYEQAGKVLDAWQARRLDPAAPAPVVVAPPAQVTVGHPNPSSDTPDAETVLTLGDLRAKAARIVNGDLSVEAPDARATIGAMREMLEAALGTSITFAGEAPRAVRVSNVNVTANDVRGKLAGVRLAEGEGATITEVTLNVHDVEAGGDVVGVEIGGGIGGGQPNAAPAPPKTIKILFLAANPASTQQLRLDQEMRAIDAALRDAAFRDRFVVDQAWAVRVSDLQPAMLRHDPDIVHFSGHGTTSSEIYLENDAGFGQAVPPAALSELFGALKDRIRCVVLNACYSEVQAQGIARHIDCVVGMSRAVGDDAAIKFATGFYRALGYGKDVQTAFDLGRNQIGLENLGEEDTPHLVARKGAAKDVSFVTPD